MPTIGFSEGFYPTRRRSRTVLRMAFNVMTLKRESSFVSPEENIAVIKLNRPDSLNALNSQLIKEIEEALAQIENDEKVRVAVVTGDGQKAFCVGIDLKEAVTMNETAAREFTSTAQRLFRKIETFEKPVIAALNGLALGGGLELALACDLRIASETAKLGSPEVGIGLVPGLGGTQRLPRILGKTRAAELILTGNMIDAKEAERIGLVNKVVPQDDLATTVNWTAGKIASNAPIAVRWAKKLVNKSSEGSIEEGNKLEIEAVLDCLKTEDLLEGVKAVFEKRSPNFKGR